MKRTELINSQSHLLVLETGDEVTARIMEFANAVDLSAACFFGIGAFERVVLAFFDLAKKEYQHIPINEQVEVVSLIGNLAFFEGKPKLHAHAVISKRDGSAFGGHLVEAVVRPTLEIFVQTFSTKVVRITDESTGLPLLAPSEA